MPEQFQLVQDFLSLTSAVDRIESTGIIAGYEKQIIVVTSRDIAPDYLFVMAGKIDKSHTQFLRAVDGEEWEHWTFTENKPAHFVRRLSTPSAVAGQIVVSLPAEYTFTFPAWLATGDRAVIPEILHLQLEKRGLLSKNSGASAVDYRVIETRENQSLAIATILQPDFPKELAFERIKRFEPSAYTFDLPQDRLVIWREQGRLTVAATRGREPVTVQVLGDSELSESAALELKCIALQLGAQGLCEKFLGVTLWGEFTLEESERLQRQLGLKVTRDAVPPPNLPQIRSKLLPPEVYDLHEKRRRRQRIRSGIGWLAAVYALGVLGLIGYIYWQRQVANDLRRQIRRANADRIGDSGNGRTLAPDRMGHRIRSYIRWKCYTRLQVCYRPTACD